MKTEIIIGAISGVIAVFIASISYFQAKKLKFFETFFNRKADAFENYIQAISAIPRTDDDLYRLSAISRSTTLYCFENSKELIESLLDYMIKAYQHRVDGQIPEEIQNDFRKLRKNVIAQLRSEVQDSKKFKFH